jgi:allantoate deiminase
MGGPINRCWQLRSFGPANMKLFFASATTLQAREKRRLNTVSSIVSLFVSESRTPTRRATSLFSFRPGRTARIAGVDVSPSRTDLARPVMQRIEALGKISDDPDRLTRTFCSPAMQRANAVVSAWMREAGMRVRTDAIGNLIGHFPASSLKSKIENRKSKILLLGSHLDTVRNAGKFDGPLGVLVAIACVQHLRDSKANLPFAIEVVGFADEEGVRYQSTYLGSKILAGKFNPKDLKRLDDDGINMAEAIRGSGGDPDALAKARMERNRLLGYVEVHIEQGPVLDLKNLSIGVVTAIAGQTRMRLTFTGRAGHAGTTPMSLRRDALCAAAEFISSVEAVGRSGHGLVATVGEIDALPGASNVIPGEARLSVDVRHAKRSVREKAVAKLKRNAAQIARKRQIKVSAEIVHQSPAVACDRHLSKLLKKAALRYQEQVLLLPSGAGHDAAAMAAITPVAMLFVRCKGGISHHPDESVRVEDVRMAISVLGDFIERLANEVSR